MVTIVTGGIKWLTKRGIFNQELTQNRAITERTKLLKNFTLSYLQCNEFMHFLSLE